MSEEKYKVMEDRLYTDTHEWAKLEDNLVVIGITDYAQSLLHDIVYVELPEIGKFINKGDVIAEIESVKTVAEVYSPIAGKIIEINEKLSDEPDIINKSPYVEGWIAKLIPKNWVEDSKSLLSPKKYMELIIAEEKS